MDLKTYPPFSVICRRGEPGRFFYAIASGGVTVNLGAGAKLQSFFLGPGQVFGEMSLLADMPVSATVRTVRETRLYRLSKPVFLDLLDKEPEIHRGLIEMLIQRLRHRSEQLVSSLGPRCCYLVWTGRGTLPMSLVKALSLAISHYSPGSLTLQNPVGQGASQGQACYQTVHKHSLPAPLASHHPLPKPNALIRQSPVCFTLASANLPWTEGLIGHWRDNAGIDQILTLVLAPDQFISLSRNLTERDPVLLVTDEPDMDACRNLQEHLHHHRAFATAVIGSSDQKPGSRPGESWFFKLPLQILDSLENSQEKTDGPKFPAAIDWLARWITRREVGLSLSAGAARGFAHLGVLEVLEQAGLPIDCLSGTSMGGVVALVYAMTGSARKSIELMRQMVGSNRKVRDFAILPRGSLYQGRKISNAAEQVFGSLEIGELQKPCAVVAADLVRGERVVIDRGSAMEAALATSAIPGLFPPLVQSEKLLTDGALMCRIPLDVLEDRRCGIRLAVNVIPSPEIRQQEASNTYRWLIDKCRTILGLRYVIAFSWELQAWHRGANDAEVADILIEPDTHIYSGYDFNRFDDMVEAGRRAAEAKLSLIQSAVETSMKPGVP